MIKNIEYKGKQYPVRVSYYALKKTQQEMKNQKDGKELTMEQIMSGDIETYEPLLYYALMAGHHFENKELEIKREEIEWVLDECLNHFIELLPSFFQDGGGQGNKKKVKK
jgi:hypothetical protein